MIGRLRERIAIEQPISTVDAEGQPVDVWTLFTTLWARAEFLSGRELEAMQKINTSISMRFTVRYRTDITERQRIYWRAEYWNIEAIIPREEKDFMGLMASKVE